MNYDYNEDIKRKIENTVLGIAIGDAFGTGLEMKDRDWIIEHVEFDRYLSFREGKYAVGYRLGDYSDDAADSLAVMETLMRPDGFNKDTLLQEIRCQYENSKRPRGGVPRAGYGSVKWVFEGEKTLEEVQRFQAGRNYPGNAPPMRAVPLGFVRDGRRLFNYTEINADVTHPHPKARMASAAIALAARYLVLWNGKRDHLFDFIFQMIPRYDEEMLWYLQEVNTLPFSTLAGIDLSEKQFETLCGPQPIESYFEGVRPFKGMNGDSMRTTGCALYILKHTDSPLRALEWSIRMGGDVDSLAAITVGITCGRSGLSLPSFMYEGVEGKELLLSTAERFYKHLVK